MSIFLSLSKKVHNHNQEYTLQEEKHLDYFDTWFFASIEFIQVYSTIH